jgi:uncharacterized protein
MLLDVSRMREPLERIERSYPGSAIDAGDDFAVKGEIALAFDIHKDRDLYRLVGRVRATLQLACSRCLEAYAVPVDGAFDLRYLPQAANTGDEEREVEEDDLTTAFYRDEVIDLGDLVREQLYLALPMKPLCQPDCQGLCPQCGANRNRERCGCTGGWVDPRLEVLRALIVDKERKG